MKQIIGQLFLKPKEAHFIALAVVNTFELIRDAAKNPKANWTPESRGDLKDMLEAGNAVRKKLEKLGLDMSDLPPLKIGDWEQFFTKES